MSLGSFFGIVLPFVGIFFWALYVHRRLVVVRVMTIAGITALVLAALGFITKGLIHDPDYKIMYQVIAYLGGGLIFAYIVCPCALALPVRAKWDDVSIAIPE